MMQRRAASSSARQALRGAALPAGRTVAVAGIARSDLASAPEAAVMENAASTSPRPLYQLSEAAPPPAPAAPAADGLPPWVVPSAAAVGAAAVVALGARALFSSGSRAYDGNVGDEYDAWTDEGILEYYWGEHIHLGTYTAEERKAGAFKKDFKKAKYDFCDDMLAFSGAKAPASILDVGCGFGGTSRHLAAMFPNTQVNGITLSPKQVERGTQLANERGLTNVKFEVMDALKMDFPDNSFDLVWACESGEHMPDKKKYVEEMVRVLKPGGHLVIACWCQREETPERPFTDTERAELQFLYDEWAHPFFISIQEFERLMNGTGKMEGVVSEDWTPQTIDSWRHSIWVGVVDPWIVVSKPRVWWKTIREIVTLERMHQAFASGLMEYGLIAGRKLPGGAASATQQGAVKESAPA